MYYLQTINIYEEWDFNYVGYPVFSEIEATLK